MKMQSFLEAYELWDIVTQDIPIPPLRENPTLAQIKSYNEEKAKRSKVKSLIQNSVADFVFYRIMACSTAKEAWDRLKEEYQGNDRTRQMRVLNLKREFESLKMKESETISEYADRISLIVNNIRLLGEDFPEKRIVEKVLVTLPERFESKISSLEESKDLNEISLGELMSALQAQEQRRIFREGTTVEGALLAQSRGKEFKNKEDKKKYILPVNIARRLLIWRNIVGGDQTLYVEIASKRVILQRYANRRIKINKLKLLSLS